MTMVIDEDIIKWLDDDIPLDIPEPEPWLKDGAPDEVKEKFKVWLKNRKEVKNKLGYS